MSSGERPIGTAKGEQLDTEALCQNPPSNRRKERACASNEAHCLTSDCDLKRKSRTRIRNKPEPLGSAGHHGHPRGKQDPKPHGALGTGPGQSLRVGPLFVLENRPHATGRSQALAGSAGSEHSLEGTLRSATGLRDLRVAFERPGLGGNRGRLAGICRQLGRRQDGWPCHGQLATTDFGKAIHCFNLAGAVPSHGNPPPPPKREDTPSLMNCFEMGRLWWTPENFLRPMPLLYDNVVTSWTSVNRCCHFWDVSEFIAEAKTTQHPALPSHAKCGTTIHRCAKHATGSGSLSEIAKHMHQGKNAILQCPKLPLTLSVPDTHQHSICMPNCWLYNHHNHENPIQPLPCLQTSTAPPPIPCQPPPPPLLMRDPPKKDFWDGTPPPAKVKWQMPQHARAMRRTKMLLFSP